MSGLWLVLHWILTISDFLVCHKFSPLFPWESVRNRPGDWGFLWPCADCWLHRKILSEDQTQAGGGSVRTQGMDSGRGRVSICISSQLYIPELSPMCFTQRSFMAESLFNISVKTNCLSDWLLFYSCLLIFITSMIYDVKNYIIVQKAHCNLNYRRRDKISFP